jgi:hypothetical protein
MSEWEKKVQQSIELLSEAIEGMTKEELELCGYECINPAYELLITARLMAEANRRGKLNK